MAVSAISPIGGNSNIMKHTLSLSADTGAATALPKNLIGTFLYQVELIASLDDAVTFAIQSAGGTELFTKTTTAATSGEIATVTNKYAVVDIPTYTLSGLGSGTLTVNITAVRQI